MPKGGACRDCHRIASSLLLLPLLLLTLGGCAPAGGTWGKKTTLAPGWSALRTAAWGAATDPKTWGTLAGAALFAIDDFDRRSADWAARRTPLFGSRQRAIDASGDLVSLSRFNYYLTALAAPSGSGLEWLYNKGKAVGLGWAIRELNEEMVQTLKEEVGRRRPDGNGDDSFPSGHTAQATAYNSLSARQLEYLPLTDRWRVAWQTASHGLSGLTGWARIEGGRHYPSDVLAAYALAHFTATFLNDAFISPEKQSEIRLGLAVIPHESYLLSVYLLW